MIRFVLPFALLAAGSAALSADRSDRQPDTEAKIAKALAGLTPGRPQQCIKQHYAGSSETIGDTILYRYSRAEVYRADTDGGCYGLRRGDAIVSRTPSDDLCTGDILEARDLTSGIPGGFCTIRNFVPYRRAK